MITSVRDSRNSVPSKDKPLPVQYYYMHVGNVTAENSESKSPGINDWYGHYVLCKVTPRGPGVRQLTGGGAPGLHEGYRNNRHGQLVVHAFRHHAPKAQNEQRPANDGTKNPAECIMTPQDTSRTCHYSHQGGVSQ